MNGRSIPTYDVLVVGAGVGGLSLALRLPPSIRIALLTKGALGESNTRLAQGGLSAAIGEDDSPGLHEADTIAAGAGLCDPGAVRELVEGAPEAVEWLLSIGARFDRDALTGTLLLGREAAHSRRRILHAGGDATGAEIERALVAEARRRPNIVLHQHAFALDLSLAGDQCTGVVAGLESGLVRISAGIVALAAGGAGHLWATTSNPPAATADGVAMAIRAGAAVADLEFVQFHPTVLVSGGGPAFLISEAIRGEGAYLRGANGGRFLLDIHPLAELAPRDVVARGIERQMRIDSRNYVNLDLRHLDAAAMRARFPTIAAELARRGLDIATDLIPVAPAAHYFIGGIAAGTDGTTSLSGLLALGEVACTGVHGANRLASNSLLEGLVFARNAARHVTDGGLRAPAKGTAATETAAMQPSPTVGEARTARERVQAAMSRHVAVVRDAAGLMQAAAEVDDALGQLSLPFAGSREGWETINLATTARLVIAAALLREESRGAHFRADFPGARADLDGKHLVFGGIAGRTWRWSTLDNARAESGAHTAGAR